MSKKGTETPSFLIDLKTFPMQKEMMESEKGNLKG